MCLAIPGQVLEIVDEQNRLAMVDVAGVQRKVNIGLLDAAGDSGTRPPEAHPPGPGDWVLIHGGVAISQVDEAEAAATLSLLRGMGSDFEAELAELRESTIE